MYAYKYTYIIRYCTTGHKCRWIELLLSVDLQKDPPILFLAFLKAGIS